MTDKPVVLTAEDCERWIDVDANAPSIVECAVGDLATGRTVVVPVMTEAEAWEAFDAWIRTKESYSIEHWSDIWNAALRYAKVLK